MMDSEEFVVIDDGTQGFNNELCDKLGGLIQLFTQSLSIFLFCV